MFISYLKVPPVACFIVEPWDFLHPSDFVVLHLLELGVS